VQIRTTVRVKRTVSLAAAVAALMSLGLPAHAQPSVDPGSCRAFGGKPGVDPGTGALVCQGGINDGRPIYTSSGGSTSAQ
jgi:hypothetical protein